MPPGRPVSEEDLHALVDGFLSPEEAAWVEAYLGANPEAAARVRDWQRGRGMLRQLMAGRAEEPVPSGLNLSRLAEAHAARRWPAGQVAAVVALALGLGALSGWWGRGSDRPTGIAALSLEAAMAQRVFAVDPALPAVQGSGDADALATWASRRLGRAIVVPDLSGAGYWLRGGRLVATEAGPACLFQYKDSAGRRIGVFVRAMGGGDVPFPLRSIQAPDVAGYAWMGDGLAFGAVSGEPLPGLRDLSDRVQGDGHGGLSGPRGRDGRSRASRLVE